MASPQISVIIASYNSASIIGRAIASLQKQTFTDFEVIIVDDASKDNSVEACHALIGTDARFKVIALEQNGGPGVARNAGIKAATGKWIAILDADDAYMPERLARLVDTGEAQNLDMIADNNFFYDAQAQKITRTAMRRSHRLLPWTLKQHLHHDTDLCLFKWGLLKPLIRKDFLDRSGLLYRPQFRVGEDSLLYAEALMLGARAAVLPEPMYIYTTSRGEASGKASGLSATKYIPMGDENRLIYFIETYAGRFTTSDTKAIAHYRKATRTTEMARVFKINLAQKNFGYAFSLLRAEPYILMFLAVSVWRFVRLRLVHKIKNKLGRLKAKTGV